MLSGRKHKDVEIRKGFSLQYHRHVCSHNILEPTQAQKGAASVCLLSFSCHPVGYGEATEGGLQPLLSLVWVLGWFVFHRWWWFCLYLTHRDSVFQWKTKTPSPFHPMMYLSRPLFLKCLHYTIKSKGWPFYNIYPFPLCWVRLRPSPTHNLSTVSSPLPSSQLPFLFRQERYLLHWESIPTSVNWFSGRQSPMTKVNLSAGVSIILCLYYASWCLYYGRPDHWLRRRREKVRPEICLKGLRPAPFATALLQHIYYIWECWIWIHFKCTN